MAVTVQEVTPFIMRNAVVRFGSSADGTDFAKATSTAALTPKNGTADFKGLKPSAVFTFPQASTWTLDLSYGQDWHTEDSLSRYLFDHRGEVLDFELNPDDQTTGGAGHTSWSGQVAVAPGAVGGPVDSVATADVSLGCVGEPTPTYTAPTVMAAADAPEAGTQTVTMTPDTGDVDTFTPPNSGTDDEGLLSPPDETAPAAA